MNLSKIAARRDEFTLEIDGETLTFGFRPGAFDDKFRARLADDLTVPEALRDLLTDWSATHEVEGKEVPAPLELLYEQDSLFINAVWQELLGQFFPNLKTGG